MQTSSSILSCREEGESEGKEERREGKKERGRKEEGRGRRVMRWRVNAHIYRVH